jgi:hypothetical protein
MMGQLRLTAMDAELIEGLQDDGFEILCDRQERNIVESEPESYGGRLAQNENMAEQRRR